MLFHYATRVFFLPLLLLVCCGEPPAVIDVPPPLEPTRVFVEALLPQIDGELRRRVETKAAADAVIDYVGVEAERPFRSRVDGGLRYANILIKIYGETDGEKVFTHAGGLNGRGRALLDVLVDADHHLLDNSAFHIARINKLTEQIGQLTAEDALWQPIGLEPAEAEALVNWLIEQRLSPDDPKTLKKVLDAIVEGSKKGSKSEKITPLPRVSEAIRDFFEAFSKKARLLGELELRIADGAMRYARDMKHGNLKRFNWTELRDAGGSATVTLNRLEQTFGELAGADDDDVGKVFAGLLPQHPQYKRLLEARERYRAIAAKGGWQSVRPMPLDPGSRSPRVRELRERLAIEGYHSQPAAELVHHDDAPLSAAVVDEALEAMANEEHVEEQIEQVLLDEPKIKTKALDPDVIDPSLLDAIKAYQETHQFRADGKSSPGFWASLNVPIARRIAQIDLNLERWRESYYDGESDFIFINVADFHAEVWRDHKRAMRFKVVVGNNNRVCDAKTGKWNYTNATPVQYSTLDHLILNPSWYVPPRLFEEALRPKMGKNPKWLEQNGYEQIRVKGGKTALRQKPGPDNALGLVKFIFPNPHNTYMHDTPQKHYFDFPVRGYSFGCVRVHTPVELAKYLIAYDGQDSEIDVDEHVSSGRTRMVKMQRELPVFTEYYTVRIDDDGRAHFLADLYRKDARRMSDNPEEFDSCKVGTRRRMDNVADASNEAPAGVSSDLGP